MSTTAVESFASSQLTERTIRAQLMGDDLDLDELLLYVKGKLAFDSIERIIDISVSRTIEGASTVKTTLNDYDRTIINSSAIARDLDIQLDGLWFRLVKAEREAGSDELDLTFEDREIAILRTFNSFKMAHRSRVTRAEFILNLIREALPDIRVVIPELHRVQPIEKLDDATNPFQSGANAGPSLGINPKLNDFSQADLLPGGTRDAILERALRVKGEIASTEQVRNANTILRTGSSMGARRKVLVCSIMTAIQESTLINLSGGDRDSVGLFQQRNSWGSFQDRHDPATAAKLFFAKAMVQDAKAPSLDYGELCQKVQISAFPFAYTQWKDEAERFVTAFGVPGGDELGVNGSGLKGVVSSLNNMSWAQEDGSEFVFYRGEPQDGGKKWKKEDSWTCIQRLANEVSWRAFFVSSTFYLITDTDLFRTQPIMIINERDDGIEGIGFDVDIGKKTADVKVPARIGTWLAPPGSVVLIQDTGPVINGRWLVNTFDRSVFSSKADITLKKPLPSLPEPASNNINDMPSWATPQKPLDERFGGLLGVDGTRRSIVQVAEVALQEQQKRPFNYEQRRPMSDSLWSDRAREGIDCSEFATLVYKEAGAPDPNNNGYDGSGNTTTLAANGLTVYSPQPGDLVFYYGTITDPGHVGVYVGGNKVIEIGSDNGILKVDINYAKIVGIKSYFPDFLAGRPGGIS